MIAGLEAAWAFFGGIPKYLVIDNFPAAVAGADALHPRLTRGFLEYSQHRGFITDPARVRHPKDKPKVERGVQYVRERFFKGGEFKDLGHLRYEAARWCRDVAGRRIHGTTRSQPLQVFLDEERQALHPWDGEPYEVTHWRNAKVHPDHHVACQYALYSVPAALCPPGQQVEIGLGLKLVRIYHRGRLIVDVYLRVRRAVMVEGKSIREVSREFGLHRDTVRKMLTYSVPPGYRRQSPPRRPKLEPYTGVIDRILEDDLRRPRKQRHTAKRIFERLRDEYGFDGGYTTVKDYVRENRRQTREMFVPLSHAPGHAQCDFGEALVAIGGVERKVHCFVIDLPHSDGCFVKAYPAETTEAFLDGHVSAFAFLGGVPQSILYDNTRLAVARILGDGRRQRTRAFIELQSHYLFEDRFGRPGKGNDKGKVEGLVGYSRRNFLVPVPSLESFDALNAHLEQRCLERMDAQLRGHTETIGQRMERDLDALLPLPPVAYDACDKQAGRVSSLSLVRYRTNDYSVPVAYGYRDVLVRGYVDAGGDQLRNRGHRQPSQIIRTRRLRL